MARGVQQGHRPPARHQPPHRRGAPQPRVRKGRLDIPHRIGALRPGQQPLRPDQEGTGARAVTRLRSPDAGHQHRPDRTPKCRHRIWSGTPHRLTGRSETAPEPRRSSGDSSPPPPWSQLGVLGPPAGGPGPLPHPAGGDGGLPPGYHVAGGRVLHLGPLHHPGGLRRPQLRPRRCRDHLRMGQPAGRPEIPRRGRCPPVRRGLGGAAAVGAARHAGLPHRPAGVGGTRCPAACRGSRLAHLNAEAMYRDLFDSNQAPILIIDTDGLVVETNAAAQRSFVAERPASSRQPTPVRLVDMIGPDAAARILTQLISWRLPSEGRPGGSPSEPNGSNRFPSRSPGNACSSDPRPPRWG